MPEGLGFRTVASHKAQGERTSRIAAAILITAVVVVSTESTAIGVIEADADQANFLVPFDVEDRTALLDGHFAVVVVYYSTVANLRLRLESISVVAKCSAA